MCGVVCVLCGLCSVVATCPCSVGCSLTAGGVPHCASCLSHVQVDSLQSMCPPCKLPRSLDQRYFSAILKDQMAFPMPLFFVGFFSINHYILSVPWKTNIWTNQFALLSHCIFLILTTVVLKGRGWAPFMSTGGFAVTVVYRNLYRKIFKPFTLFLCMLTIPSGRIYIKVEYLRELHYKILWTCDVIITAMVLTSHWGQEKHLRSKSRSRDLAEWCCTCLASATSWVWSQAHPTSKVLRLPWQGVCLCTQQKMEEHFYFKKCQMILSWR